MNTAESRPSRSPDSDPYPPSEVMKELLYTHYARDGILAYLAKFDQDVDWILTFPDEKRGSLVDIGILRHLVAGNIDIKPFRPDQLTNNGYDVRLGEHHLFHDGDYGDKSLRFMRSPIYNPNEPRSVRTAWGEPKRAASLKSHAERIDGAFGIDKLDLKGIEQEDLIILLEPGITMLGHTEEFIGGRRVVTTRISGNSTTGRHMLEICSDANLGAVGFRSRWTLEITNKSLLSMTPLVVGQVVATITFEEVEMPAQSYDGRYQEGRTIEEIEEAWVPEMMIPKPPRIIRG